MGVVLNVSTAIGSIVMKIVAQMTLMIPCLYIYIYTQ